MNRYSVTAVVSTAAVAILPCTNFLGTPRSLTHHSSASTHHSLPWRNISPYTHTYKQRTTSPTVIPPHYINALLLLIHTKALRYSIDYHTINNHRARNIASFLPTPPQQPRLLSSPTPDRLVTERRRLWACGSTPGVGTRRLRTTGWLTFWSTWLSRGPENAPRRGSRRR